MRAPLALALVLIAPAACDGSRGAIVVELKTDFVAGVELAGIRTDVFRGTEIEGATPLSARDTLAGREPFLTPRRIAEVSDLDAGQYTVRVRLLDARGDELATRVNVVRVRESRVLVLVVVPRRMAECSVATECPIGAACARAVCEDRVCLYESEPDACAAGEWCNPESGCEPLPPLGDAGVPDAGPMTGTACNTDADCGGAVCFGRDSLVLTTSAPARICTHACCSHADCPEGTVCWTPGNGTRACVPPALLDPFGPPPWTPCAVDADCPGDVCRLSDEVVYWGRSLRPLECGEPRGARTSGEACGAAADCVSGICASISGTRTCTAGCATTADCETGACLYFQITGGPTVLPLCADIGGAGTGARGATCVSDADCVDALCADGRCADTCCRDAHCPEGSRCRPLRIGDSWQLRCR